MDGLPIPPFLLSVVAPRISGKTNLVVDALTDNDKFMGKFDAIFVWSRTAKLDGKWKNISLPEGSFFDTFNEDEVETLVDICQQLKKVLQLNILFIFDDMITEGIMNPRRMGVLESLAVRGRHFNISLIIISQQYLALSPSVRNNTTNMCIFRVRNGDEMEKITRENREGLEMDQFKRLFYSATNEPYSFLHINNQKQNPLERFHRNWKGNCYNEAFALEEEKRQLPKEAEECFIEPLRKSRQENSSDEEDTDND